MFHYNKNHPKYPFIPTNPNSDKGTATGLIVTALNHGLHEAFDPLTSEQQEKQNEKKTEEQNNKNGIKKFPNFEKLKKNYPPDNSDGTHAKPSKDGYKNQCAIRLGYALINSGEDISDYDIENQTSEGYPRSSRGLAEYLKENYEKPKIMTQQEFDNNFKENAQGIIYLEPPKGYLGHIDIIYGKGQTMSGYYGAIRVWYWQIK